ncbi:MAG: hypothetical protein WB992_21045 [Bryobacteraceae bacterium]
MRTVLLNRWTPYALYLLLAAVFWNFYAVQLNSDGISYLTIAREYAIGQWSAALNAYWSPLFSWLIAGALALHAPGLQSARLILLASGLTGIAALRRYSLQFCLARDIRAGLAIIAAPVFAYFAMKVVTPDCIALTLLLLYFNVTCANQSIRRRNSFYAGFLGALLYLTKAYSFVFVAAHLTLTAALRLRLSRQCSSPREIVSAYSISLASLLLFSGPWLILIGIKTGHPILSTAGSYNYALAHSGRSGHPMLNDGFFPPPNPDSVSVWEDPSRMSMPRPRKGQMSIIGENLLQFAQYTGSASIFSPFILMIFAWMTLSRWRRREPVLCWACLLVAYLLYPLGYIPILIDHRYVWIEDLLLLLMAGCILDAVRTRVPAIAAMIIGLSFWCVPVTVLIVHRNDFRDLDALVQSLRPLHLNGNIASNARWDDSQYLCYELGLRYYGVPARNETQPAIDKDLEKNNIKHVFLWSGPKLLAVSDVGGGRK